MVHDRVLAHLIFFVVCVFCVAFSDVVSVNMENSFCRCGEFPLGDKKPLVAIWNAPTGGCNVNFSIHIDLKSFDIQPNPKQQWNGKAITVFYNAQLGLYPYFTDELGTNNYNGGMPQQINLKAHLRKASEDIMRKIPDADFSGLAMIDWEGWRPLWDRNFDSKNIYQTKSIEMVRELHPGWPMDRLINTAKREFEKAAKTMMEATIRLAKELRPKGLWGFYGFPDCYGNQEGDYQCSAETRRRNDELEWLFASSNALYPSIYMYEPRPANRAFAHGRLAETFRIVLKLHQKTKKYTPVFPYFRHIYEGKPLEYNFLSDEDLHNTIGQAAEMGSSGVVMWGNRRDENTSPEICYKLNNYIRTKLGPYFESVKHTSEVCSTRKCSGRGWCISKQALNENWGFSDSSPQESCPGPIRDFTDTTLSGKSHKENILDHASVSVNKTDFNTDARNSSVVQFVSTKTIGHTLVTSLDNSSSSTGNHKSDVATSEKDAVEGITVVETDELSVTASAAQLRKGMTSGGVHYEDEYTNRTANFTSTTNMEAQQRTANQMVYCNRTADGSSKCVVFKPGHHTSTASKLGLGRRIPKTYIYIFCGSAVGALAISAIYIVAYYYFKVRRKSDVDACASYEHNAADSQSSRNHLRMLSDSTDNAPHCKSKPIYLETDSKPQSVAYINTSPNSQSPTKLGEAVAPRNSFDKKSDAPSSNSPELASGVSPYDKKMGSSSKPEILSISDKSPLRNVEASTIASRVAGMDAMNTNVTRLPSPQNVISLSLITENGGDSKIPS